MLAELHDDDRTVMVVLGNPNFPFAYSKIFTSTDVCNRTLHVGKTAHAIDEESNRREAKERWARDKLPMNNLSSDTLHDA